MTDEQEPKTDFNKPSEGATGRQVAAWLRRGIKVHHKNQAAEKAAAEAKQLAAQRAAFAQMKAQEKAAKVAAIRAGAANSLAVNVTPGKVAAFLWMPQLNHSFRGFSYAAAILVQIFARILISVGLLPPDHPARTPDGAMGFGVYKLLEEARLNILPLRALREAPGGQFSAIRMLAMRQYLVYSAVIGLFVTGFLSIVVAISHVVFGTAFAFAAGTSSVVTSGTGIGGCSMSGSTGDLAAACLDGVFGTSSSGAAASLVGAGLGTLLRMYSNLMLIFAGIIVLWIIISMVAETARTGVPFGKNFNPVWTPIRLIVALGLLVPLSSGLNSGQYIVINLAKWGSSQATQIWTSFTNTMLTGNSSSGGGTTGSGSTPQSATNTINNGIPNIPLNNAATRTLAQNLFRTALCAQISQNICKSDGSGGCQPVSLNAQVVQNATNESSLSTATGKATPTQSGVQNVIATWKAPDANGGGIDCGSLQAPTYGSQVQQIASTADQAAVQSILTATSNNSATLGTSLQSAAGALATLAQQAAINGGTNPGSKNPSQQDYNDAINSYITNQSSSIVSAVAGYNNQLNQDLLTATKQFGWIYAPVWFAKTASSNANVVGAAQVIPVASGPPAGLTTSNGQQSNSSVVSTYNTANTWLNDWDAASATNNNTSPKSQATDTIISDLQGLTSDSAGNPLLAAGTYGREMLLNGFKLIEPADVTSCFNADDSPGAAAGDSKCLNIVAARQQLNASHEGNHSILPSDSSNNFFSNITSNPRMQDVRMIMYPIGMIMISMGFMLTMITFIPLSRFILGVLNWFMMVFEAVLAVPLLALSLLSVGGDGFSTQQFTSNMWMLVGVVLRPPLMAIGMVMALVAFNDIMIVTNQIFATAVGNMTPSSDNSLLSLGIYVAVYASLCYTLANSAFKMIDLMPNWVMNWIGARMESRVDDASAIQQQTQQFMSTLAYSNKADQADLGSAKEKQAMRQEIFQQAQQASTLNKTSVKTEMGPATESVIAAHGGLDPFKK